MTTKSYKYVLCNCYIITLLNLLVQNHQDIFSPSKNIMTNNFLDIPNKIYKYKIKLFNKELHMKIYSVQSVNGGKMKLLYKLRISLKIFKFENLKF